MQGYGTSVKEISKRTVIIKVENLDEALQKVRDVARREEIILHMDDYDE